MKVFISSVMDGMGGFREAVAKAIDTLGNETVRAEDFSASPNSPRITCLEAVRSSDAMILILGERYGDQQDSGLSATHEEYRKARKFQQPVLVMVQEKIDREPQQQEFVQEVQKWETGQYTASFGSTEELHKATIMALHQLELRRTTSQTVVDRFKEKLMDFDNWQYDGVDKAVYLVDPDYSFKIQDAGPEHESGQYWWSNQFVEIPKIFNYCMRCKGEKIHRVLMIHYYNECLTVPYPEVKNLLDPRDSQGDNQEIDCFCDVFYYSRSSMEYAMYCHVRKIEANAPGVKFSSPIRSQIKPPIIKLPFLLLENDDELQLLANRVQKRLEEFVTFRNKMTNKMARRIEEPDAEKKRMLSERWFSDWVWKVYQEESA